MRCLMDNQRGLSVMDTSRCRQQDSCGIFANTDWITGNYSDSNISHVRYRILKKKSIKYKVTGVILHWHLNILKLDFSVSWWRIRFVCLSISFFFKLIGKNSSLVTPHSNIYLGYRCIRKLIDAVRQPTIIWVIVTWSNVNFILMKFFGIDQRTVS